MKQSDPITCPKCAAVIPDEAPGGLCPKCALERVATVTKTMSGGRKSAPPGIAEIAPHFPELEILELIGAGGMGAVSGGTLEKADPGKGRFRSYLLGALKHFLADRRRAESRQKRGGDVIIESIESGRWR